MKNFKKIIAGLLCVTLICLMTSTTFNANDTNEVHSFYHNPANDTPDASTVDKGLEYFARFKATNTQTNTVEFSSKNWNTSQNINIYSLVENNADVFDMTNSKDLALIGELKNTTENDISVTLSFELPDKTLLVADNDRISSDPVTGNFGSNFNVKYNYQGANYSYAGLQTIANFSWSDVRIISFTGKLGAKESASLNLPVKLSTTDAKTINVRVRSYAPSKQSTWLRIRASKYMYTLDEMMSGVYMGAYRETINGVDTYKKVPDSIQAKMPEVIKSDFIYSMFNSLYRAGNQANLTQPSDNVVYDHSQYLISTERIFNAIKDDGYSVYRDNTRGLWNSYAYYMGSNLKFTDDNGNAVNGGVFDAKANVLLSNYYVELHKVFDTKDITIYVGENWNQFDNLIYRQSIATKGSDSHYLTDDEIGVKHNVNNLVPGVYTVTYLHQVDTDKFVTKTAKVTVIGKYNVDYKFQSTTPRKDLPETVNKLLPKSQTNLLTGTTVVAENPSQNEVIVENGKWVFKHYDQSKITISDRNITFNGYWEFIEHTQKPTIKPITPSNNQSDKIKVTPDTSDNTNVALSVIGIVIGIVGITLVLRKKT